MEPLALGKEPGWVNEQRKKDYKSNALQRKDQWTPYEDDKLRYLLKQQKYGYAEVVQKLYFIEVRGQYNGDVRTLVFANVQ